VSRRVLTGPRLVLATHNAGKVKEVADLLAPWGFAVVSAGALGLPEPAETEETFVGNARIKALSAARASNLPALADDSGFCVVALDGAPGVRTADWAETPAGRDYAMAMAKVEKLARHAPNRSGAFCCALVLAWPDGHTEACQGEAQGRWVWPPRGTRGFGFDPMFVPDGETETFGEMDPARKHAISHRAAAFRLLAEACLPPRP
jgi:XTP/dITP diphosphohydrolase